MNICHLCKNEAVADVLDCGTQPVCNRFLTSPTEPEAAFPMVIGQCEACGLVQISHPVSPDEILSRYDWITYNEPEGHLEEFVEHVAELPGITIDSFIGAVVFGSDTTITRFQKRGFARKWRIDLKRDLGVQNPKAGVETIQEKLTPESAADIVRQQGKFDLLIVRHMVEHSQNLRRFLNAIRVLVKPTGYVVFEAPDCEKPFATCDYSILWEEHVFYFMPETFRFCLEWMGFDVIHLQRPGYSLVTITRPRANTKIDLAFPRPFVPQERGRMNHFVTSFPGRQKQVADLLDQMRARDGKIAFFGAGHLACVYVNVLKLKEKIECIIDDHPKKRGMFMPGSRLPILGSAALLERSIKVCLSTLSPETEKKVAAQNPAFVANGGRFLSVFAGRANSIPI